MSSAANAAEPAKEPQTKAGLLWRSLHTDSEFSAAYINAVVKNDHTKIVEAFKKVNQSPPELSKEEYLAFLHGRTPSGELEVTAWGGYYVTDQLPDGRVFALFISSTDNSVYWGAEDGFADRYWLESKVDYRLGPDATLGFSFYGNDVTLSFSNDFNEETGEVSEVHLKGTIGAIPISAARAAPPLPSTHEAPPSAVRVHRNVSRLMLMSISSTPEAHVPSADVESDSSGLSLVLNNEHFKHVLSLGLNYIGRSVISWCAPVVGRLLGPLGEKIGREIHAITPRFLQVAFAKIKAKLVDLGPAEKTLTEEVTSKLYELLRKENLELRSSSPESVINDPRLNLKEFASEQLRSHISEYISKQVESYVQVLKRTLPEDVEAQLAEAAPVEMERITQSRTEGVMKNLAANSAGIDAIVNSTVSGHFKTLYETSANNYDREIYGLESVIQTLKVGIDRKSLERKAVEEKLKEFDEHPPDGNVDLQKERDRQRELQKEMDHQITIERQLVEQKQAEMIKAEAERKKVEQERDVHEKERKERKGQWDRELRRHLGKR